MNTIEIQNLKCHGCANTITNALQAIKGVKDVAVNVDESTVSFETDNTDFIDKVKAKLSKLGYPEVNSTNTGLHKAKSYVSCAVGRLK